MADLPASGGRTKMFSIYVIKGKDDYRYVGITSNMAKRLHEHNNGKSRSTKNHRPFIVLREERCSTRKEARAREIFLKSGQGRKFLDTL